MLYLYGSGDTGLVPHELVLCPALTGCPNKAGTGCVCVCVYKEHGQEPFCHALHSSGLGVVRLWKNGYVKERVALLYIHRG